MVNVKIKILLNILVFSIILFSNPALANIPQDSGAVTWTRMNMTFYVHSTINVNTGGVSAKIKLDCVAGQAVADSTCPSVGYFVYTLDKMADPTTELAYYKFYKTIDRGSSSLPDTGWVLTFKRNATTSERALLGTTSVTYDYTVPRLGGVVDVTLGSDGTFSNGVPAIATPAPALPGAVPPGSTVPGSTTAQPSGDLTADLNANITASGIDDTKCPTGQTTYQKGILKGVSCTNATRSLEDVLMIVKNIVNTLLLPIVGILFIIMIIIGGILYITSAGNQQRVDRGKKILTTAIIGLLIVTLSYTLIAIFTNIIGGGIS